MTYQELLDELELTKPELKQAIRNIEGSSREMTDSIDTLPCLVVAFNSHHKAARYLKLTTTFKIS